MHRNAKSVAAICLVMITGLLAAMPVTARAEDDLLPTVIAMLQDKDKDVRTLGLEQVRDGLKGAAHTHQLVALLAQLPADAQAALIIALGDRGDPAALPGIKKFIDNSVPAILRGRRSDE